MKHHSREALNSVLENVASQDLVAVDDHIGFFLYMVPRWDDVTSASCRDVFSMV